MNTGDTAFVLLCAAFVFFMTPGLAFFYGGLVRRKSSASGLLRLSDDVCHDHTGSDHRFPGGPYEIQSTVSVHSPVVAGRLLPSGAYGMGRGRFSRRNRFCGFCRRKRRTHQLRRQRSCPCAPSWKTPRI